MRASSAKDAVSPCAQREWETAFLFRSYDDSQNFPHYCLVLATMSFSAFAQNGPTPVATGLEAPYKLTMTPAGNLLVRETANGPNAGRINFCDSVF